MQIACLILAFDLSTNKVAIVQNVTEKYSKAALRDSLFWPDYDTARQEAGFSWSVAATQYTLLGLMEWSVPDILRDPDRCIELYKRARPLAAEKLPEDANAPAIVTPPISYGHANGLGCPLKFPEEQGDVGVEHAYQNASLEETIDVASRDYDWASRGDAPFYIDYYKMLKDAFPGENVGFAFGKEGPVTTAYELRGEQLFYDLMSEPEKTRELFLALAESAISFQRFHEKLTQGESQGPNPDRGGMCDDIAAMVPPDRFADLVLPAWDCYYRGMTTGRRFMHVEDLRREQLHFVQAIGVATYDPGVSPKLTPRMIAEEINVPFKWRLNSTHYPAMEHEGIRKWVYDAVAEGPSQIFTIIAATMCDDESLGKVRAFIEAAKEAAEHLDAGDFPLFYQELCG